MRGIKANSSMRELVGSGFLQATRRALDNMDYVSELYKRGSFPALSDAKERRASGEA